MKFEITRSSEAYDDTAPCPEAVEEHYQQTFKWPWTPEQFREAYGRE
jgi:hypothetical protein